MGESHRLSLKPKIKPCLLRGYQRSLSPRFPQTSAQGTDVSRGRTRRRDSGVTPRTPAEGAHTCTQEHGEILGRPQTAWREAAPAPRLQVCRAELNHKGALPSHYEGRSGEEEEKPGRPLPHTAAAAAITGLHTQRLCTVNSEALHAMAAQRLLRWMRSTSLELRSPISPECGQTRTLTEPAG